MAMFSDFAKPNRMTIISLIVLLIPLLLCTEVSPSFASTGYWKLITQGGRVLYDIVKISGDIAEDKHGHQYDIGPNGIKVVEALPMNPGEAFLGIFDPLGLIGSQIKKFMAVAGSVIADILDCNKYKPPYLERRGVDCGTECWKTFLLDSFSSAGLLNIPLKIYIDYFCGDTYKNGEIVIDWHESLNLSSDYGVKYLNLEVTLWKQDTAEIKLYVENIYIPAGRNYLILHNIPTAFFENCPSCSECELNVDMPIKVTGYKPKWWFWKEFVCEWEHEAENMDNSPPNIENVEITGDSSETYSAQGYSTSENYEKTISFHVSDNNLVDCVSIFIDGVKVFEDRFFKEKWITYHCDLGSGRHQILIEASDAGLNTNTFTTTIEVIETASQNPPGLILKEPDGIDDSEQDFFTILYRYSDPDSGGTISFFYDRASDKGESTPAEEFEGYIGSTAYQSSASYKQGSHTWYLRPERSDIIPPGTYFIYARISDGTNTETVRSPGAVTVQGIPVEDNLEIVDIKLRELEGDGDLIPEPGERIEVQLKIKNHGDKPLSDVKGRIMADSMMPPGTVIEDGEYFFGALDPGEVKDFSSDSYLDYIFRVFPSNYDGVFEFGVYFQYRDASGKRIDEYDISPACYMSRNREPRFEIADISVQEDDDNDGKIESGEDVKFRVKLRNVGSAVAVNIHGQFDSISEADLRNDIKLFPDIPPGSSEWSNYAFSLYDIPKGFSGPITVNLRVTYGKDGQFEDSINPYVIEVAPAAYLRLVPREYYFGVRSQDSGFIDVPFTITNTGSETLNITGITLSHSNDTQILGQLRDLGPNESLHLTARIDISALQDGDITRTITVQTPNAHGPVNNVLTISGNVSRLRPPTWLGSGSCPEIYDNHVTWEKGGAIYIKDVISGDLTIVQRDGMAFSEPVIHGYDGNHIIAMTENYHGDIWIYNLETGELRAICTEPGQQFAPQIWDRYVIWKDERNGEGAYGGTDIYGYDLQSSSEFLVERGDGDNFEICINNGIVAFHKQRVINGAITHYLVTKVLPSGERYEKAFGADFPKSPSDLTFYGDMVVFDATDSNGDDQLWAYNIESHSIRQLTSFEDDHENPQMWECGVVYEDKRATRAIYSVNACNPSGETPVAVDPSASMYNPAIWEYLVAWEKSGSIYCVSLSKKDLTVDLLCPPGNPVVNQTIPLNALVSSSGEEAVVEQAISFYDDTNGSQIGQTQYISLNPGESTTVSVNWSPLSPGQHVIRATTQLAEALREISDTCTVTVNSDDTYPPQVSDIITEEFNGDGDGIIDEGESVKISCRVGDESGVASTNFNLDGTSYSAKLDSNGRYYVIVGPFEGNSQYSVNITATDLAFPPNTATSSFVFHVYDQPTVTSVTPCGNMDVPIYTAVEVIFNMDMIPSSLNPNSIILEGDNGVKVASKLEYVPELKKATLVPEEFLEPSYTYHVRIRGGGDGVRSETGGWWGGEDYVCQFRTAVADSDQDGINDRWELTCFGVLSRDGSQDYDGDGIIDSKEYNLQSKPNDADTDDDGIPDGIEDANHNGIVDPSETDPCNIDTDGDGVQDGTELGYTLDDIGPGTDTSVFQPDLDPSTTTNPLLADTDGDGYTDGEEDVNNNGAVDANEMDPNIRNLSPTGKPYFVYCNVAKENSPTGINIYITAAVLDTNGSLPGSIDHIYVTGPSGFSYTFDAKDYRGSANYAARVAQEPVEGEYTFTVVDSEGKVATSHSYLNIADTIPVLERESMQASGDALQPTLSWAPPPSYEGSLFYLVKILDASNNIVWASSTTSTTSIKVPGGVLSDGVSYNWQVIALNSSWDISSSNRAVSETIPLTIDNTRPYFDWAVVYNRHESSGYYLDLEARVVDPNGSVPGSISSFTVTGPQGFTHSFGLSDYDEYFGTYWIKIPRHPQSGIYTFTVTDTEGKTATTYDYLEVRDIPLIDPSSLHAIGDPLSPTLTWSAPAEMVEPLYYRAIILDGSGNWVWGSNRTSVTSVKVPTGILHSGVSYSWRVRAVDQRWWGYLSNRSQNAPISLGVESSALVSTFATLYSSHSPDGYYTGTEFGLEGANSTLPDNIDIASVEGPDGTSYAYLADDFVPEFSSFSSAMVGTSSSGTVSFFARDMQGNEVVNYDYFGGANDIPLFDEGSFLVSGDKLAPTVSWSAISGYKGRLYYRLVVTDELKNWVYASAREPLTAQSLPYGILEAGKQYFYQVQAFDADEYVSYNNRVNSSWHSLSVSAQFIFPVKYQDRFPVKRVGLTAG